MFYMAPRPDAFIDIAGDPFDTKVSMGLEYASQLELLTTEARERLSGLGVDTPLLDMPNDQVWPEICRAMAGQAAKQCREMYPGRSSVQLAEGFRIHYPGILEKLRDNLPGLDYKDE